MDQTISTSQAAFFGSLTGFGRTLVATLTLLLATVPLQAVSHLKADEKANPNGVKQSSFRDRAVDLVILKDQTRLYGSLSNPDSSDGIHILVRTESLRNLSADFFKKRIQPAIEAQGRQNLLMTRVTDRLQQQIKDLQGGNRAQQQRSQLLRETIIRMQPEADSLPDQVWLTIPRQQVKRFQSQPPQRKQLGRLAILNNVTDCEVQSWKVVAEKLGQIPTASLQASLAGDQQVSSDADSVVEQAVSAVMAAIDVQSNASLRLVQNGDQFFPEDQQLDLQALLGPMLTNNIQQQLSDLLGPEFNNHANAPPSQNPASQNPARDNGLPASAQQLASARNVDTVIISSFQFDLSQGWAGVTKKVVHNNSPTQWKTIFTVRQNVNRSQLTQSQKDAVTNDPQVQTIAGSLGSLAGAQSLQTALELGACVKVASDQAEHELQEQLTNITNGQLVALSSKSIPEIVID